MSAGSILFVDEDRSLVESLAHWFEEKGYDTVSTFHPLQRLMLAAECKYDVVVIDIGLPEMDGLEVLDELVQRKEFPVIVLSADACPILVSRALEIGAFTFLVKPAALEDLESAIESALS
jgi:two-component system KDP operon response regulator KdpE